jgi:hypothetical protein
MPFVPYSEPNKRAAALREDAAGTHRGGDAESVRVLDNAQWQRGTLWDVPSASAAASRRQTLQADSKGMRVTPTRLRRAMYGLIISASAPVLAFGGASLWVAMACRWHMLALERQRSIEVSEGEYHAA